MKKKILLINVFLGAGLVIGGVSALSMRQKDKVLDVRAESGVNAVFQKIYAGYNNVASGDLHYSLMCFTGTAHGAGDVTINDADTLSKIKINDVALSELSGSKIVTWGNTAWMYFYYPDSALDGEGTTLEVEEGLTVGASVIGGYQMVLNASNQWDFDQYNAEEVETEVTGLTPEVYSSFYRFNLSEYDAGPQTHAVAFAMQSIANDIYYGDDPANKLIGAGASGGWNCLGYLGSVKSFGGALSELTAQFADIDKITIPAGTRFPSIKFFKPDYEGDYKIYVTTKDAILKKVGSSWQLIKFVEDDELIKNNDFLLFTPSDYFGGSNDDWFFFTKVGGTPVLDTLNFGLQYELTLTDTELAGYQTLRFGTSLTGNDYLQLLINYKVNTYISSFNGVAGNIPSSVASINVSAGTHTYEFYSIKVAENSVRFIFGIDGELIFKTDALDATGAHCQHIALHSGSTGATASAYSECATTKTTAINRFYNRRLTDSTVSPFIPKYLSAKAYIENYLTPTQQTALAEDGAYAGIYSKYQLLEAEALTEFKNSAKAELADYAALNEYAPEDQTTVDEILANGNGFIDDATTFDAITQVVTTYKGLIDGVPTAAQRLEQAKTAAKAEIAAYKADVEYREEEQIERTNIIEHHSSLIDNIGEYSQIGQIAVEVTTAKAAIDALPTKAERDLQDAKAAAKAELEAYVSLSDYREAEKALVQQAIDNGKAAIDEATSVEQVNAQLAAAKAVIDDIPTDADLTLEERKISAKAELDAIDLSVYRAAQREEVEALIAAGKTAIDEQTTLANVNTKLAEYLALIDEVKTDAELLAEYKATKKAYLDAVKEELLPNYRAEEQALITTGVAQGKTAIDAATSETTIDQIIANLQAQLATLKTDNQYCHEEAAAVDTLINAIGTVTLDSEEAITTARNAYNALSAKAKGYVDGLPTLEGAEARLATLKQEKANADAVEELINAIGTVDATKACKDRISAAEVAYYNLNAEEKTMVSNKATLDQAIADFDNAVGQARQAALDEIDEFVAGLNMKKYTAENQEVIRHLAEDAKEEVQAQTYSDNLAQIVADFEEAVNAIPQKKAPAKKGCGGSIVATSIVLSTLALAGLGLAISKKRKQD